MSGKIKKNGYSLIEIMIAFGILSLAFIAIVSSFPTGLSISKSAEIFTLASYIAQEKVEEVNSLEYDSIATGTIEALHRVSSTSSDPLYHYQRKTEANYVDVNLNATSTDLGMKKISVTVYFKDPATRSDRSYNLTILNSEK